MRSRLPEIAREIGADDRTLRRAAARGAVHCHRPGARQLELPPGELDYLRTHWRLLATLSGAFRTEPNVAFAMLIGSAARGDDRTDSDVDLLAAFRTPSPAAANRLAIRLERTLERDVDVFRLDRVLESQPLAVVHALAEGRILVDRDDVWPAVRARRMGLERAARSRFENDRRDAIESLNRLLAQPLL